MPEPSEASSDVPGSWDGSLGDADGGAVIPEADASDGRGTATDAHATDGDATLGDAREGDDGGDGGLTREVGASDGSCPSGFLACDSGCRPNDIQACGACGNDCTQLPHVTDAGFACNAGGCSYSCAAGFADCADSGTGCKTDLSKSPSCGACGVDCPDAAPVCGPTDAGLFACATGCTPAAPTLCNQSCVDTSKTATDCAMCGNACTTSVTHAQPACVSSACTFACNGGYAECGGACVDEQTDSNNCGGCGAAYACTGGMTCQIGHCACPTGYHDCGGTCQINTSLNNCGTACGVACTVPVNGTAGCNGTSCTIGCNASYTPCGGACVSTASDPNNCNACGNACPYGLCQNSTCAHTQWGYGGLAGPADVSIAFNQLGGISIQISTTTSVAAIGAFTNTAALQVQFGLYAANASHLPTSLIAQTGILTTLVGATEGRVLPAVMVSPGEYWILALPMGAASLHFAAESNTTTWLFANSVPSLPATAPSMTQVTANIGDFYIQTAP